MTKRPANEHDGRDSGEKSKPAQDRADDNLKKERTVDNKVIMSDRAKEADGFSMDGIKAIKGTGSNDETDAKTKQETKVDKKDLQKSGNNFRLVEDGATVAQGKKKAVPHDAEPEVKTKEPKPKWEKNSEIYDSETIGIKAVQDKQMEFYKQVLDGTTDPKERALVKQQATLVDKMFSMNSEMVSAVVPAVNAIERLSDTVSLSNPLTSSDQSESKAAFHQNQESHATKNAPPEKSRAQEKQASSEPLTGKSTLIPDNFSRPGRISNGHGEYSFSYLSDMDTRLSTVTIKDKSGHTDTYQNEKDHWLINGKPSNISDIVIDHTSGKLFINYKDNTHRIDYPNGKIEYLLANEHKVTTWPDGSLDTSDGTKTQLIRRPDGHGGFVDTHTGQRPDDNFTIAKTADGRTEVREKPGDKVLERISGEPVESTRRKLNDLIEKKITNPEELARFKANMARFENRAHDMEACKTADGKPIDAKKEIADTYSNIARLLEAGDKKGVPVDQGRRTMMAEQIMRNAATPTIITQGDFNTCNVAAVEVRAYMRHPSAASKLVVDMATTGEYKAGGKTVKINPEAYQNFDEPGVNPPTGSTRSLASQVFQVTAVNVHYAQEWPNHHMHYDQFKPDLKAKPPNYGEALRDDFRPGVFSWKSPGLKAHDEAQIAGLITGDQPKESYIRWSRNKDDLVSSVTDQRELQKLLREAQANGKMPITIRVHTENEPLYTDSGSGTAGGSGDWHVINVTKFEEGKPPLLTVDNQWSAKADHTGKNRMTLDDLYFCMREPTDKDAIHEMELRRGSANPLGPRQAMDLDRHKFKQGQLSLDEYERNLKSDLSNANQTMKGEKNFNFNNIVAQYNSAINDLPPDRRFELIQAEMDLGAIDKSKYLDMIVNTMSKANADHRMAVNNKTVNPEGLKQFALALKGFAKICNSLSEKDRLDVNKRLIEAMGS